MQAHIRNAHSLFQLILVHSSLADLAAMILSLDDSSLHSCSHGCCLSFVYRCGIWHYHTYKPRPSIELILIRAHAVEYGIYAIGVAIKL